MKILLIARLLAGFTAFFTLALLVPFLVSLGETSEIETTSGFLAGIVGGITLSVVLWFSGRKSGGDLFRREGLAMVGLAWFLAGGLAAIPFVWSGAVRTFPDAFFESISGLTTTGATVLGTANPTIESQPPSILLWRAMLQWMGGIGIVLVFIVLLPLVGVTGSRLLSSEQVGMSSESARPRMKEQARRLLALYVGLTLLAAVCYWLVGLSMFDSLCHSFTTLATGGFSNHNVSVGGYQDIGVEVVAIVFMFLAGCNFVLMLRVLTRRDPFTQIVSPRHSEFVVYLGLTLVIAAGITMTLWAWGVPLRDQELGSVHAYESFGRCVRDGLFQTVSILTTTGYANANFENWPKPALYLIFLCMFIGGCSGSTAGGFKVLRAIVCFKLGTHSLRRFVQPRIVETLRVGPEVIPESAVLAVTGLLVLWIGTVAAGALILDLDPRLDFVSALTASVSMMGCVGPAFGEVVAEGGGTFEVVSKIDLGPYSGYGQLHWGTKIFMSIQMILGRLEILAPLALFAPRFWIR